VTFLPLLFQYAESPPSKGIAVPVIQEASSDARNTANSRAAPSNHRHFARQTCHVLPRFCV
jgi:hypothetical protein